MATSKLDPFEKLLQLCSRSVDVVPPGWFTVLQLQKRGGGTPDALRNKLQSLAASGEIQSKKFRIKLDNDKVTAVTHYKTKD